MDNGQWTMDINTIKETERGMDKAKANAIAKAFLSIVHCPLSNIKTLKHNGK